MSVIRVRVDAWCPEDTPDPSTCYDASRAATTHLYPNDSGDGHCAELREADIEINSVHFAWSLDGDASGARSLRAIVAHEVGHALGLDHSCSERQPPAAGAPSCDDPGARSALMYPVPVEPGRELVHSPTPGEAATVCSLYEGR